MKANIIFSLLFIQLVSSQLFKVPVPGGRRNNNKIKPTPPKIFGHGRNSQQPFEMTKRLHFDVDNKGYLVGRPAIVTTK